MVLKLLEDRFLKLFELHKFADCYNWNEFLIIAFWFKMLVSTRSELTKKKNKKQKTAISLQFVKRIVVICKTVKSESTFVYLSNKYM